MTRYQEWLSNQSAEFRRFVHKNHMPESYHNESIEGITLAELQELDDRFINNPEGK